MRTNQFNLWSIVGLSCGLLSAQAMLGADSQAPVNAALAHASSLELPSKTAGLIAGASEKDRRAVSISAVQAAVTMNPSAAAAIVSAVATKVPSAASVAASTAAELQPSQAARIAQAAATAAPGEAASIVKECSQKLPSQYASIAVAASKAAPAARQDILIAASQASPAPVRASLVAAAGSPSKVPVDVSIARAYNFQGAGHYDSRSPGFGDRDGRFPGGALQILRPFDNCPGPVHHSGSPITGHEGHDGHDGHDRDDRGGHDGHRGYGYDGF